jgi:hypothetical protein
VIYRSTSYYDFRLTFVPNYFFVSKHVKILWLPKLNFFKHFMHPRELVARIKILVKKHNNNF